MNFKLRSSHNTLLVLLGLVFFGIVLQVIGIQSNAVVMDANGDKMPVWAVFNWINFQLAVDPNHCRMTWATPYKPLGDIIIVPDFTGHSITVGMASIGDLFIYAGNFLMAISPIYVLAVVGLWLYSMVSGWPAFLLARVWHRGGAKACTKQ